MRKVTLDDLAKELNISKGTVDRAIHNRPGVSAKTKAKVLALVEKYNYRPDKLARMMSLKGEKLKIGVVCPKEPAFFWEQIILGLKAAEEELLDFGLELTCEFVGPLREANAIMASMDSIVEAGVKALIIVPVESRELEEKINELKKQGITVVTLNDDLVNSQRLFYVGPQLRQSGRVAADFLGKILQGKGKVATVTSKVKSFEYKQRLQGFQEVLQECYPSLELAAHYTIDPENPETLTLDFKELAGIYNADGATLALLAEKLESEKIVLVGHELSQKVGVLLEEGVIDAVISQDPFSQGYFTVKYLFDFLVDGTKPPSLQLSPRLELVMKENFSLNEKGIINPYYLA